jgi:hypothetical protein
MRVSARHARINARNSLNFTRWRSAFSLGTALLLMAGAGARSFAQEAAVVPATPSVAASAAPLPGGPGPSATSPAEEVSPSLRATGAPAVAAPGPVEPVDAHFPVLENPPAAPREFRAAWVATVSNIDWPSKPGLSTWDQQAEIIAILNRAVELKLNALIVQIRTTADALYASEREPWSQYLTGTQGEPPFPYYDPL